MENTEKINAIRKLFGLEEIVSESKKDDVNESKIIVDDKTKLSDSKDEDKTKMADATVPVDNTETEAMITDLQNRVTAIEDQLSKMMAKNTDLEKQNTAFKTELARILGEPSGTPPVVTVNEKTSTKQDERKNINKLFSNVI